MLIKYYIYIYLCYIIYILCKYNKSYNSIPTMSNSGEVLYDTILSHQMRNNLDKSKASIIFKPIRELQS